MDGALQSARLRGAELSEVASEVASELVEQISEYSARILQEIATNSSIPGNETDADRHKGGRDEGSGSIITSNSIFGISFNSIIQFAILGAVGLFAYKYYQKNLKN